MDRLVAIAACVLTPTIVLAASAPAAAQAALPVEDFTRSDSVASMKISPTGEYVAWLTGKDARTRIAVLRLRDKKVTGGADCPRSEEQFEIYDFEWVSPTRLIFRVAERGSGEALARLTGEIFGMDFDGGRVNQIYGVRGGEEPGGDLPPRGRAAFASAEPIRTYRDDGEGTLIAEYPWRRRVGGWSYDPEARPTVYRLDVFSGRKQWVDAVPLGGALVLVDRNDQVRVAFGRDEKSRLAVSWKPEPTSPWTTFDLPGFRERSVTPRVLAPFNLSVLFTGAREGEPYTALYRMDLKSNEITKVYGFEHAGIGRLIYDFRGDDVVGVEGDTADPSYHWFNGDDPAAKIHKALFRAFANQHVFVTSSSKDGKLAVVFAGSDVNPGTYFLFDTEGMNASRLQVVRPWVDPASMRPMAPFSIKARDGLELHGFVTKPAGKGPFPLVVLPHGGPFGIRDTWSYDPQVQLLASRGYAVLQVNFRGSGGYGIDFEEAGYREWGGKIQDDITDATRWAIEQGIAVPDRIGIFGTSFGGYAALMGVVREPKLYRCAIGCGGVYDLELLLRSGNAKGSKSGHTYLEKMLGTDRAELAAHSPVNNAKAIEVPVLLIHGKNDRRADFAQAKRMKAALDAAGKKFEWVALSHEGHGIFDEETRRDVYERVLEFLDRNLAPIAASGTR